MIEFKTSLIIFFYFLSGNLYADSKINSSEAAFHTGKSVIVCGPVVESKRFKKGIYLNMDKPYPNQSLTLIIWESDLYSFQQDFGDIDKLVNKSVCAKGTINEYRGRSQISLHNSFSLKLQ